ncbi:MAG: WbuC family cupin fold metalloprotein [Magnetococcales bacterium]|nr:WbuC family cupin fold metalloprotein [Magnetococcales bacterium]
MSYIQQVMTEAALRQLSQQAAGVVRRRQNLNWHPQLTDPVQRMFNALEPGTYVRPHRHNWSDGWELFLLVAGEAILLTFDERGRVVDRYQLGHETLAVEIAPAAWHTIAACCSGTVFFECKRGPYRPNPPEDMAVWSPDEGDPDCRLMEQWFHTAKQGDRF